MKNNKIMTTSEEQLLYAVWLEKGMLIGLVLLVTTFALYVFDITSPVIPPDQLSGYWGMPVKDYLAAVNTDFLHMEQAPTSWAWLKLINRGDYMNLLPITILSGITILCYIVMVSVFKRKGEKAYMLMSIAEVVILTLAASGILAVSH